MLLKFLKFKFIYLYFSVIVACSCNQCCNWCCSRSWLPTGSFFRYSSCNTPIQVVASDIVVASPQSGQLLHIAVATPQSRQLLCFIYNSCNTPVQIVASYIIVATLQFRQLLQIQQLQVQHPSLGSCFIYSSCNTPVQVVALYIVVTTLQSKQLLHLVVVTTQ